MEILRPGTSLAGRVRGAMFSTSLFNQTSQRQSVPDLFPQSANGIPIKPRRERVPIDFEDPDPGEGAHHRLRQLDAGRPTFARPLDILAPHHVFEEDREELRRQLRGRAGHCGGADRRHRERGGRGGEWIGTVRLRDGARAGRQPNNPLDHGPDVEPSLALPRPGVTTRANVPQHLSFGDEPLEVR